MGFFAELRRRHVLRAAALYGAVGWLPPTLNGLRDDPRFKTQMKRIRHDLARQRVEVESLRKG